MKLKNYLCRYTISINKNKINSFLVKFKNTLKHCICNNFEYNILTHICYLYKSVHNAQSLRRVSVYFVEHFTRKIIILGISYCELTW